MAEQDRRPVTGTITAQRFVKLNSNGTVSQAGDGDPVYGVALDAGNADVAAQSSIAVSRDSSTVTAVGTLAVNDLVQSDASGRAVALDAGQAAGRVTSVSGSTVTVDLTAKGGGSGASVPVAPCWFGNTGTVTLLSDSTPANPSWAAVTDGVAAGTDVVVDTDTTALKVVEAGTYLVTVAGNVIPDAAEAGTQAHVSGYLVLNDESVGPAYYVTGGAVLQPDHYGHVNFSLPLVLAADDLLRLSLSTTGATADATIANTSVVVTFSRLP